MRPPRAHKPELRISDRPRSVAVDGQRVARLGNSPIGWQLLRTLATQTEALDRESLYERVWRLPYSPPSSDNTLFVNLSRLRRLLAPFGITIDPWGDNGYAINGATCVVQEEPGPTVRTEESSPIIGRESELARLHQLLAIGERWVTLTGPGGVGKSTLASAIAESLRGRFLDARTCLSATALEQHLAASFGVVWTENEGARALYAALRAHDLLVLDNLDACDGVGRWAAGLMSACSGLRVIATSRRPLGLRDECAFGLGPLGDEATRALLVHLLRTNRIDLAPEHVAALCAVVDGVPLACEVAVATLRSHAASEVIDQLRATFPESVDGQPETQHALTSVLEASWVRLDPQAQRDLLALSTFEHGMYESAARAVTEAWDGVLETGWLRLLPEQPEDFETRYRLLIPLRAFLRNQRHLLSLEQWQAIRDRHAAHFAEVVQRWHREGDSGARAANWERDFPEIRAAAFETSGEAAAICAFHAYWHSGWYDPAHARAWIERTVELGHEPWATRGRVALLCAQLRAIDAPPDLQADAGALLETTEPYCRSMLLAFAFDGEGGEAWEDRWMNEARSSAARQFAGRLAFRAWQSAFQRGAIERSLDIEREAVARLRQDQKWATAARQLAWGAIQRLSSARFDEGRRRMQEARTLAALGDSLLATAVVDALDARITWAEGHHARAAKLATTALCHIGHVSEIRARFDAQLVHVLWTRETAGASAALAVADPYLAGRNTQDQALLRVAAGWLHDALDRSGAAEACFEEAWLHARDVWHLAPTVGAEFAVWQLVHGRYRAAASLLEVIAGPARARAPMAIALLAFAKHRLSEPVPALWDEATARSYDDYQRACVLRLRGCAEARPHRTASPAPTCALLATIADADVPMLLGSGTA